MRNLILLFVRFGGVILFFVLEGICFYLIVQFNKDQQEIAYSSASLASGFIYDKYDNLTRHLSRTDYADSLARANAQLYQQLDYAKFSHSIWRDSIDDEEIMQQYIFTEARVINNTTNLHNNSITINRGTKHGIETGMGVIGNTGIVGIVKNCSTNFSRIMSLLHRQTKVTVSLKKNDYFGSLVWKGSNPRHVSLEAIPKHAQLVVGDTVQTSGYSAIFPEGIMVGKIDSFWLEPGSNFYTIDVELNNNLTNIKYVYVVSNLYKKELEELEEAETDE